MRKYPKIRSIYKRNEKTHKFIEGQWSLPEFDYLQNNRWVFTEKVDGTNIRVMWDGERVLFGGKTERAQVPTFLLARLQDLFPVEKFRELYADVPRCLYGEGYGAKIQKGGGNYKADGVDFVLFDVNVGGIWLERHNVDDIADKLSLLVVPVKGYGSLYAAIRMVREGISSEWGPFRAEGLVMRPRVELVTRRGERIIAKIKHKDFPNV